MNRIGIKIDLDTGDLVSGAARARQSIDSITDAMKKAQKEGRHEDYVKLSFEKDRLQFKASGFDRDIKTLANDPRLQTQTASGVSAIKMDSEYEGLIKSQNEAMRKLTDEFHDASRSGDVGRIRQLTPQIERQQSELQRTIRDIINTGGDFSKRQAVKNVPISGGLPKEGDWREFKGISGAITQEHDAGNWEQVSRLGSTKDALRGIMGEYDRDSKLEAKIKADPEFASQLKEIRDALKGTIAAIDEAAANGEYEKAEQLTGQAKQLQGISHNTVQEAAAPLNSKTARDASFASFLNVQTAQQMVGAVTNGINTYVAHLDRSSIVNAMGGGDVMGAQIDELHRSAAEKSALWGSVGRIGGGILGGFGALALAPFTGGASLLSTGAMVAGGTALGSTLFGAGGDLVGTLGDEKKANEMATSEAYAKLWERQAPEAMELTAMFGKYGGADTENSNAIRRTFENAANTATEYGYSPEEGMEQAKQAAYQGLDEKQSLDAARDVFAFERGTGADRGALSEFRNRTERFGVSGGLNTAWQGRQASGMAPAQFNEFLRSMQRTFEDGISKGFVRGADEIAGNLSFLSNLNGDSELWKGEQGANRLAQMNTGLAATTALSSVSDILSFRGAQNVLAQWDNAGMTLDGEGRPVSVADKNWGAIGDLDPKNEGLELRRGYDYIDAMAMLERGLTPELFHSQMQMIEGVEGVGNRTGAVEQMKNIYGLNYTGSAALYQSYQNKLQTFNGDRKAADAYFSGDEWKEILKEIKDNPDNNNSTELTMFSHVNDIRKYTSDVSQWHLDQKMPEIADALKNAWEEAKERGSTTDTAPGEHADPYPPEPPPVPDPHPAKPFNYETATPNQMREEAALLETQGKPGVARSYSDEADNREELLIRDINAATRGSTRYLFSEGFLGLGKENSHMTAINETVGNALISGDYAQFDAAKEFSDIISRYGTSNKAGKPYDDSDTFNSLANFNGDMMGMLNALRSLIERIDGVEVNVSRED